MTRKPIGVWFSIALGLCLVGLLLGAVAGRRVAPHWVIHSVRAQSSLTSEDQRELEAELAQLTVFAQADCVSELLNQDNTDDRARLHRVIDRTESITRQGRSAELTEFRQFELSLAHLQLASQEAKHNEEAASEVQLNTAQDILRALGWQDVSPSTLDSVAQRQPCGMNRARMPK